MKRPSRLRVGYVDYKITPLDVEKNPGALGVHMPVSHEIRIAPGLNKKEEANTLLHETLHAVIEHSGIQMSDEAEEQLVLAIANGLCQVIQDNPTFLSYLTKGLKK